MKLVLDDFTSVEDQYPLDQINCYEKPIGIAAEGYRENGFSIFIMLLKFMQSYNTGYNHIKDELELIKEALLWLDFRLNEIEVDADNLHATIKTHLQLKTPVLVNGNQRELYYSDYFQEGDWPHLYLIVGFDEKKRIYHIIDGSQHLKTLHVFERFYLKYDDIQRLYLSFLEHFHNTGIYTLEDLNAQWDEWAGMNAFLDAFERWRELQPFKELDLMNECYDNLTYVIDGRTFFREMNELADSEQYQHDLLGICRNKTVFFKELVKNLQRCIPRHPLINELSSAIEGALEDWKVAINQFIVSCFRKKRKDVTEICRSCLEYERNIDLLLAQIRLEFNRQALSRTQELKSLWRLENNGETVIQLLEDRSFMFTFNESRTYPSWSVDDAPKAVYRNSDFADHNFVTSVTVNFQHTEMKTPYHAGFVLKTQTGDAYFWGVYCGNLVVFNQRRSFELYGKTMIEPGAVQLQIRKKGNAFYFGLANSLEEGIKEVFVKDDLIGLSGLGLGCKTWDDPSCFTISFSHFDMHVDK